MKSVNVWAEHGIFATQMHMITGRMVRLSNAGARQHDGSGALFNSSIVVFSAASVGAGCGGHGRHCSGYYLGCDMHGCVGRRAENAVHGRAYPHELLGKSSVPVIACHIHISCFAGNSVRLTQVFWILRSVSRRAGNPMSFVVTCAPELARRRVLEPPECVGHLRRARITRGRRHFAQRERGLAQQQFARPP